jgi:hypothetical protein
MKIRNDYVSNSSSSSFIVVGNRIDQVSLDDLESLSPEESIFLVLKGYGNDGDYIFELTPELLMDCDMRHIDFNSPKLTKVRGRYVVGEGGYVSSAKGSTLADEFDVLTGEAMRKDGVSLDGMRMYRFNKDWDTPTEQSDMIDNLKQYTETGF